MLTITTYRCHDALPRLNAHLGVGPSPDPTQVIRFDPADGLNWRQKAAETAVSPFAAYLCWPAAHDVPCRAQMAAEGWDPLPNVTLASGHVVEVWGRA